MIPDAHRLGALDTRPEAKRALAIIAWLEAHPAVPWPTITREAVHWQTFLKPMDERAVLGIDAAWKVMLRKGNVAYLTGFHAVLGCVLLDADRWRHANVERDWAELNVAVAS
jgi:hypothetical protein